jgi:hypothetical protein
VIAIGKAHNVSAAQVELRWLIQQNISAVTAANNLSYIKADLDVFSFELTTAEMATLSALPPSPPPPPSACLQSATFRHGGIFEDSKDVESVMDISASDCTSACCADSSCGHFVYPTYMPSGQGQKMCWFKTAKAGKFTDGRPNCTSGTVHMALRSRSARRASAGNVPLAVPVFIVNIRRGPTQNIHCVFDLLLVPHIVFVRRYQSSGFQPDLIFHKLMFSCFPNFSYTPSKKA